MKEPDWSDPEFRRSYDRQYYRKRRDKVFQVIGDRCANCGSGENLQVDHKDPSSKAFNISSRLSAGRIRDELAKCQPLCADCHRHKTTEENSGFTHGTIYAWMKKKCECPACQGAKEEWTASRNRSRRIRPTSPQNRLSPQEKKTLVEDRQKGLSYRALGKKYGVHHSTAKYIVDNF